MFSLLLIYKYILKAYTTICHVFHYREVPKGLKQQKMMMKVWAFKWWNIDFFNCLRSYWLLYFKWGSPLIKLNLSIKLYFNIQQVLFQNILTAYLQASQPHKLTCMSCQLVSSESKGLWTLLEGNFIQGSITGKWSGKITDHHWQNLLILILPILLK